MTTARSRAAELEDAPLYRYRVTYWLKDRPGSTRSANVIATNADGARTVAARDFPDFLATVVPPRRLGPLVYVKETA